MTETCMIIDGNSLMHRAFHALPLMDANGVYTNAVHGFLLILLRAIEDYHPEYCVVAFDEHGPTFRHTEYEDYKAGRAPTADELVSQFDIIKEVLNSMHIGVISLMGYEADDLLGTISRDCGEKKMISLLVSGDRDALQLVSQHTHLLYTRKGISEITLFDPPMVFDLYGITPEQVTDWKGLMGDASDNIPGIPGVGEKTSIKLLKEYGTMESVLEHADDIKGKLGENIRSNKEQAVFSKWLATINTAAPIKYRLADWSLTRLQDGLPTLKKYELNTIYQRLAKVTGVQEPANEAPKVNWHEPRSRKRLVETLGTLKDASWTLLVSDDEITVSQEDQHIKVALKAGQQSLFEQGDGLIYEEAMRSLRPLLNRPVQTHFVKDLFHRLDKLDLPLPEIEWDTMVAAYLNNPQEKSYSLQAFGERSSAGVLSLQKKQEELLNSQGMLSLYETMEVPLIKVLFHMEKEGFQVDGTVLTELGDGFTRQAEQLQEGIFEACGAGEFNINSPQQLGKVLFDTLGLPTRRKTAKGKSYSTDAATLEAIRELHPAVGMILSWRQVTKLNSTYIEPLLRNMDASGRVHTTFEQTGTATGRISSNDPNLQNIPVRTDIGREIRRAFRAKEGCVLVDGDYSQIELRILAHMSGDKNMRDTFIRGEDIHTRTAALVNGVGMEEVTDHMRSAAKAVNFGIVYGISDFGLAQNIGISRKEAAEFIAKYFTTYPGVHEFMERAKQEGRNKGYSQTLYGRRRPLPELQSSNFNTRSFGERVAINTPIQGTAADIIKAAMVRVHEELLKGKYRARLILQVHDELIIETPQNEMEKVQKLLKNTMENIISLDVPLLSDVNTGVNWYESK